MYVPPETSGLGMYAGETGYCSDAFIDPDVSGGVTAGAAVLTPAGQAPSLATPYVVNVNPVSAVVDCIRHCRGSVPPEFLTVSGACTVFPGTTGVAAVVKFARVYAALVPADVPTVRLTLAAVAVPPFALAESDHSASDCCDDANTATAATATAIAPQTFFLMKLRGGRCQCCLSDDQLHRRQVQRLVLRDLIGHLVEVQPDSDVDDRSVLALVICEIGLPPVSLIVVTGTTAAASSALFAPGTIPAVSAVRTAARRSPTAVTVTSQVYSMLSVVTIR